MFWGPDVSQSLTLGGEGQPQTHGLGLNIGKKGFGCSIWESWAFKLRVKGQHQCSGVLMSDLRKMVEEDREMESVGRKKKRNRVRGGRGEWQGENCKALRE